MGRNFGIDLGTTNTVVSKFSFFKALGERGEVDEIKIYYPAEKSKGLYKMNGKPSLPSVVYLEQNEDTGEYIHYVGEVAEYLAGRAGNREQGLLINTKRLMSKETDLGHGVRARDVAKDLYEICLYSIGQVMTAPLTENQSFCVTRPAGNNPFATVATMDVIKEFGFKKVYSIEEPVAALLNYLRKLLKEPDTAEELFALQEEKGGSLVFGIIDIGGGTTDVKIQKFSISGTREIDDIEFETGYVITFDNREQDGKQSLSNPYMDFGGLDFDRCAAEYMLEKLRKKMMEQYQRTWPTSRDDRLRADAMLEAKKYKEQLSQNHPNQTGSWNVPAEKLETANPVRVEWNAEEYNRWVEPLLYWRSSDKLDSAVDIRHLSVRSIIENVLEITNYKAEELDCLYITGGMSCYQPLREMIEKEYKEKVKIVFSDSPLIDIAEGAALYNAYFRIDIPLIPLNEGIMLDNPCGAPIVIAETGSELPLCNKVLKNKIVMTNPVEMPISILSGKSIYDSNMRVIKRLYARDLPITRIGTLVDIVVDITEEQRVSIKFIIKQEEKTYVIPVSEEHDIRIN